MGIKYEGRVEKVQKTDLILTWENDQDEKAGSVALTVCYLDDYNEPIQMIPVKDTQEGLVLTREETVALRNYLNAALRDADDGNEAW